MDNLKSWISPLVETALRSVLGDNLPQDEEFRQFRDLEAEDNGGNYRLNYSHSQPAQIIEVCR